MGSAQPDLDMKRESVVREQLSDFTAPRPLTDEHVLIERGVYSNMYVTVGL